MGAQKDQKSLHVPMFILFGVLIGAGSLGLYLSPWRPASTTWLLVPFMTLVTGLALVWRHRWMYWLSSSGSLIGLLAAFMATESNLSRTTLSFLYLFVRV
jgi:hypothetical protein